MGARNARHDESVMQRTCGQNYQKQGLQQSGSAAHDARASPLASCRDDQAPDYLFSWEEAQGTHANMRENVSTACSRLQGGGGPACVVDLALCTIGRTAGDADQSH